MLLSCSCRLWPWNPSLCRHPLPIFFGLNGPRQVDVEGLSGGEGQSEADDNGDAWSSHRQRLNDDRTFGRRNCRGQKAQQEPGNGKMTSHRKLYWLAFPFV